MKILVAHRGRLFFGKPYETYARSMIRVLREKGHEVIEAPKTPPKAPTMYNEIDLLLDIDCGRDEKGKLHWHCDTVKQPVKSAVYLIDSHGYPSLHRRIAKNYDHVFFCVWNKRDLFANHPSAHWCPNFTDLMWFDGMDYDSHKLDYDFGFFGSKGGLDRAKPMIQIANDSGWKPVAKEIGRNGKPKWPGTAEYMSRCRNLFNHGQKHDGPNLRVMESMAMRRPLITDQDPRSGMDKLFEPWTHYVPYEAYTYNGLKKAMHWAMQYPDEAMLIALNAYDELTSKHLVEHRIDQILEVTNAC